MITLILKLYTLIQFCIPVLLIKVKILEYAVTTDAVTANWLTESYFRHSVHVS